MYNLNKRLIKGLTKIPNIGDKIEEIVFSVFLEVSLIKYLSLFILMTFLYFFGYSFFIDIFGLTSIKESFYLLAAENFNSNDLSFGNFYMFSFIFLLLGLTNLINLGKMPIKGSFRYELTKFNILFVILFLSSISGFVMGFILTFLLLSEVSNLFRNMYE